MDDKIYLSVGFYEDVESAEMVLETLESMNSGALINLVDAAILTKAEDGKLHVDETRDVSAGKGARRGAVIMGVFGLIFPPSIIASALVGGGLGALAGQIRDTGIKRSNIRRVAEQLEPGKTAVVVLSDVGSRHRVEETLNRLDGGAESHELGPETSQDVIALAGNTAATDDTN